MPGFGAEDADINFPNLIVYSDSDGDVVPEVAEMNDEDHFVRYLIDLLLQRSSNSRQFCELTHYAGKAGIEKAVRFGLAPNIKSGHFSRKVKKP